MATLIDFAQLRKVWKIATGAGVVLLAVGGVVVTLTTKNAAGVITRVERSDGSSDQSGALLVKDGSQGVTLRPNGDARMQGTLSGAKLWVGSMSGAGLTDCDAASDTLNWDSTTQRFICGTDGAGAGTFGTGNVITIGDARYVNASGDTMTGQLAVDITGGGLGTVGVKVINTLSGAVIHAEKSLSSSGTIVATNSISTRDNLFINVDNSASDASLTFGNDSTAETLIFDRAQSRFEFSDEVSVLNDFTVESGFATFNGTTILGDGTGDGVTSNADTWTFANDTNVNVNGGLGGLNFDTSTLSIDAAGNRIGVGTTAPKATFDTVGTVSGTHLTISSNGSFSGSLVVKNNLSGSSVFSFGLGSCSASTQKLLYNNSTGKFSCASDQTGGSGTFGTGNVLTIGDARYVNQSGDTMTGALTISVTSGNFNTIGAKVINTLSGAHLHSEKLLTASGFIIGESGALLDSGTFYVDAGNNRVGIGTTSPIDQLSLLAQTPVINLKNSLSNRQWKFRNGGISLGGSSFDIYDGTAAKSRFILDANGNATIGSGVTALNSRLYVWGGPTGANVDVRGDASIVGGDQATIELEGNDYDVSPNSVALRYFGATSAGLGNIAGFDRNKLGALDYTDVNYALISVSGNTAPLVFALNDREWMRLNATGSLGIGTTTPGSKLSVSGAMIIGRNIASAVADSNATLEVIGNLSGSRLTISNNANFSGSVIIKNSISAENGGFVYDAASNHVAINSTTTNLAGLGVTTIYADGVGESAFRWYAFAKTGRAQWILNTASGSQASPVAVTAGRVLAEMVGQGYNGSTYVPGAGLMIRSIMQPNAGSAPGEICFNTTATGAITLTNNRMCVKSEGEVTIGKGSLAAKAMLDVIGTISGSRLSISNNANISGALLVMGNTTIRRTLSGNIIHAEKDLTSSGTLTVKGTMSGRSLWVDDVKVATGSLVPLLVSLQPGAVYTNNTAEADTLATVIPANTVSPGDIYYINFSGSGSSVANHSALISMYVGGTILTAAGGNTTFDPTLTEWTIGACVYFKTAGASATAYIFASIPAYACATSFHKIGFSAASGGPQAMTLNTTANIIVKSTANWNAAATTDDRLQGVNTYVEKLHPASFLPQ